jgi:hypothetical protein
VEKERARKRDKAIERITLSRAFSHAESMIRQHAFYVMSLIMPFCQRKEEKEGRKLADDEVGLAGMLALRSKREQATKTSS